MNALSRARASLQFQRHELTSLWEIMFEYQVDFLIEDLNAIERFENELLGRARGEEELHEKTLVSDNPNALFTDAGRKRVGYFLEMITDELRPLSLTAGLLEAEHIRNHSHKWSASRMAEALNALRWKIQAEIRGKMFIHLDQQEAELFKSDFPFGLDVAKAFPSLEAEIRSAAKCLALEMSTASAFHSIRSLEGSLRALARCLGIPDPVNPRDRNWGEALKPIKAEMDRRWNAVARMAGDGKFFEEAYAVLAAMRNPYRNSTMHLEQNYDQKDARYVFDTVKVFLQKISSRMNENGEPFA